MTDKNYRLIKGILHLLVRIVNKIESLETVVDTNKEGLEIQQTDIGRALLEIREAKSVTTDWLADQVKLELLEQDIRELKVEIQHLKSRLPEEKSSE